MKIPRNREGLLRQKGCLGALNRESRWELLRQEGCVRTLYVAFLCLFLVLGGCLWALCHKIRWGLLRQEGCLGALNRESR